MTEDARTIFEATADDLSPDWVFPDRETERRCMAAARMIRAKALAEAAEVALLHAQVSQHAGSTYSSGPEFHRSMWLERFEEAKRIERAIRALAQDTKL